MKDHRKGIVNREIRDAAQHELKHWKQRNAVKKKADRVTEKGRADKKDTVAEQMEQAYELTKEGTITVGQMAARTGVKKPRSGTA